MARIVPADRAVDEALAELRKGGIVALPTETVYGLAADATNGLAVARIFEAKRRPSFNPLIAHVSDFSMAARIAVLDPISARIAEHFWPGPLTIVVGKTPDCEVHDLVTAGLETIAVRMPRGIARELAARLTRPLAIPSANPSGRLSPTTAEAVDAALGDRVPLIIDGGPADVGIESTICRVEAGELTILRPGGVPAEQIEAVTGLTARAPAEDAGIAAPGMLTSHYAPASALRMDVTEVRKGEALLAFGPERARHAGRAIVVLNLSESGDLPEAASNLYAHLHALDAAGAGTIAVEPVPFTGLGIAINDRLGRAAAPRDDNIHDDAQDVRS